MRRKRKKNINGKNDLDLHGIRHMDVDVIVEEHVLLHTTPFQIITGHSETMKQIVRQVLDRHAFKYQEGILNAGCILVL